MIFLSGFFLALLAMEFVAWAMHRFLFHGPLWFLHKSHHDLRKGSKGKWRIEKNDAFGLFFALIAIFFMCLRQGPPLQSEFFAIGCGVTLYGFLYFLMHDAFVHHRFISFGSWPLNKNGWLEGLREAHRFHHRCVQKEAKGPYGLFFPFDYKK